MRLEPLRADCGAQWRRFPPVAACQLLSEIVPPVARFMSRPRFPRRTLMRLDHSNQKRSASRKDSRPSLGERDDYVALPS
jgi:hypothetical protein